METEISEDTSEMENSSRVKAISVAGYIKMFPKALHKTIRLAMQKLKHTILELDDGSGRIVYESTGEISYSPLLALLFYFFGGYESFSKTNPAFLRDEHPGSKISRPPDASEFYAKAIKAARIPSKLLRSVTLFPAHSAFRRAARLRRARGWK